MSQGLRVYCVVYNIKWFRSRIIALKEEFPVADLYYHIGAFYFCQNWLCPINYIFTADDAKTIRRVCGRAGVIGKEVVGGEGCGWTPQDEGRCGVD